MAGNGWDLPPGARGPGWQWSEPPPQDGSRWNSSSMPQQGGSGTLSPTLAWDNGNALHAQASRGWDAGSSQGGVSRVSGRMSPQPNGWDQGMGREGQWGEGGGNGREFLSGGGLGTPGNRPKGHGWQDPNAREFVPAHPPHAPYRSSGLAHTPPDTPQTQHGRGWDLPPVSVGGGSAAGWQSPTLPQNNSWGSQHSMSPTARQPSPPSVTWDEESIRASKTSRVAVVARGGMGLRPPGNRGKRGSVPAAPVYKGPIPTNRGWGFEKQTMLKAEDKRGYDDYESDRLSYRTAGSEFSNRGYNSGYGNVPPDDPVHMPVHVREAAYGAFPRPGSASSVGSGGREHVNPGYDPQLMQFERGPASVGFGLAGGRGAGWSGPPVGRGAFEGGNRSRGAYLPEGANWPDGRSSSGSNLNRYEDASSQFYNAAPRGVAPWGGAGPMQGFRDMDYPSMAGSSGMGGSDSESDELDIASDDELEGFEGLAKEKEEKAYKKYRRVYLELLQEAGKGDGAKDQWKCLVCKNRTKFWFNSLHALHQHAETKKNEWRIQHRGLARALRELLSRDPMGPLGIHLPPVEDDDQIIVWPPAVILQNTRVRMDADGHWNGLGATEIREQYKNFNPMAVRPAYGPDGHKGCCVIQFAPDPNGFDKAVQLSNYFEKQSRSRDAWEAHGSRSKRFDDDGKLLVFGYLAQPKDMWQLDKFAKGKNGKAGQLVKWWTESKKEAVDDEKVRREQQRLQEAGEVSRLREKAAEDGELRARVETELKVQSKKLRNLQERYTKMEQLQQQQLGQHKEELESVLEFYDVKYKAMSEEFTATEQDALAKRREREAADAKRLTALETLKDGAEEEGEKAMLEQQMASLEEEIAANLTTAINHKDALGEMEMAHTEELLELRKRHGEEELALRQKQQEQKAALLKKLELSAPVQAAPESKGKLSTEAPEFKPKSAESPQEGGPVSDGGKESGDAKTDGPKEDDSHAELVGKMVDEVLSDAGSEKTALPPEEKPGSPHQEEKPSEGSEKSVLPAGGEAEVMSPLPKMAAPKGPLTKSRFVVLEDTPEPNKTTDKVTPDMLPRTLSLDDPSELTAVASPQGFRAYKAPTPEQQSEEGGGSQSLQQALERMNMNGGEGQGMFPRSNSAGGAFGGVNIRNGVLDAFSGGWEAPAASALEEGSASWADVAKKEAEKKAKESGALPAGQPAGS